MLNKYLWNERLTHQTSQQPQWSFPGEEAEGQKSESVTGAEHPGSEISTEIIREVSPRRSGDPITRPSWTLHSSESGCCCPPLSVWKFHLRRDYLTVSIGWLLSRTCVCWTLCQSWPPGIPSKWDPPRQSFLALRENPPMESDHGETQRLKASMAIRLVFPGCSSPWVEPEVRASRPLVSPPRGVGVCWFCPQGSRSPLCGPQHPTAPGGPGLPWAQPWGAADLGTLLSAGQGVGPPEGEARTRTPCRCWFPGEGVSGVHRPDFRPSLVLVPQFCEHPLPPSPSAELSQSCKSTACNQNNLTDVRTVTGGRLREHLTQPFILQLNKLMDVRASSLSALSESALFLSVPTAQ